MACAVCFPVFFTAALIPRLSILRAVIPTLMAELTALSVACPTATPYLQSQDQSQIIKEVRVTGKKMYLCSVQGLQRGHAEMCENHTHASAQCERPIYQNLILMFSVIYF